MTYATPQATPANAVATRAQLDRLARHQAVLDHFWEDMQDQAEVSMLRLSVEPRRFVAYAD